MSNPQPNHTAPATTGADMNLLKVEKPEKFTAALSKLVLQQPFYAVILMDAMRIHFTDSIPTMATDGVDMYINPKFSESMTVDENMFVICHEVLHYVYQHMPRSKMYEDRGFGPDLKEWNFDKFNQAADHIINDVLIRGKVGSMPQGQNKGLHDVSVANFDDIADDVYMKLPDPPKQPPGGGGGHGNFDQHLPPGSNAQQPSDAEVKRTLSQAKNSAKAQGKMPADLERLVNEVIEPKKDWKELLMDSMVTSIGNEENTWNRPNRRKLVQVGDFPSVYWPGRQGFAAGYVVVQIDTSGSIGQTELDAFLGEVAGILGDANPEGCKVLWTDSRVAGVDDVEYPEELYDLKAKGGGGTDMGAGVRWCIENDVTPSTFVTLTDGYTPYPDEPPFPCIWVVTEESMVETPPFGVKIHMDLDAH